MAKGPVRRVCEKYRAGLGPCRMHDAGDIVHFQSIETGLLSYVNRSGFAEEIRTRLK
jgi:hypothetical protein